MVLAGRHALAACICCTLLVAQAATEEKDAAPADAPGLKLLRPDSLVGWDYGDPPSGWTIDQGRLSGSGEATELVSGFTFGDFRLTFRWSAAAGAECVVGLPAVPDGKKIELHLADGKHCGVVKEADRVLFAGRELSGDEGREHRARIARVDNTLALSIDGKPWCAIEVPAERRYGLTLAVRGGSASLADLRASEPRGEAIFNGRDLTGWWTPGNKDAWKVENGGELVKRGGGGNYLRTEKQYGNFTLSFQYKISRGGNSGVGIRTARNGWPSGDGMELQLLDHPGVDFGANMSIYRNVPPVAVAHKSQEWNDAVIKADGYVVSAWVNGELVQQANTYHHPELKHRHLEGWIGFQDHGGVDQFRNIDLLEAPAGLGLSTWYRELPPRGVERVLDRLMNPERLADDDRIRSGAIAARLEPGEKERVLAELTGPGALVQLGYQGPGGRLAFYFDGQEKPRIDVPAKNLAGAVPRLAGDNQPVITYLGYAQSLKIVASAEGDAPAGTDYRIEYVTFSPGIHVETFTDKKQSIPRGWLATIDYRHSHHKYGQHREADLDPRTSSGAKRIEPGSSVPLVHLPGSGVLRWMKLVGDRKLLASSDLWIHVAVDGQSKPVLSAPARFLFAAIADGHNHDNFVMLNSGGATSMLAMPFGNGLGVSAENRGTSPLASVGLTVSYEPDKPGSQGSAGAKRLRGVFQDASAGSPGQAIALAGSGRLVGLVIEPPAKGGFELAGVTIDGQAQAAWQNVSSAALLGAAGESEFRRCLSGQAGGLAWRYFLLAPWEFSHSLRLEFAGEPTGSRLVLYYAD